MFGEPFDNSGPARTGRKCRKQHAAPAARRGAALRVAVRDEDDARVKPGPDGGACYRRCGTDVITPFAITLDPHGRLILDDVGGGARQQLSSAEAEEFEQMLDNLDEAGVLGSSGGGNIWNCPYTNVTYPYFSALSLVAPDGALITLDNAHGCALSNSTSEDMKVVAELLNWIWPWVNAKPSTQRTPTRKRGHLCFSLGLCVRELLGARSR